VEAAKIRAKTTLIDAPSDLDAFMVHRSFLSGYISIMVKTAAIDPDSKLVLLANPGGWTAEV
jgi:hypothetical protein